jgi:hypothetical protein
MKFNKKRPGLSPGRIIKQLLMFENMFPTLVSASSGSKGQYLNGYTLNRLHRSPYISRY